MQIMIRSGRYILRIAFTGIVVAALFIGCGGTDSRRPITLEELRSVTISGLNIFEEPITLVEGGYEGDRYAEGMSARSSVQLMDDIVRTGDVTSDGIDDAIVFVSESGGGSGSILYLVLLERDGISLRNTATASLGDRAQIRSAMIENGVITVDLVQHADTDPMCCPGDLVRRSWQWKNGMLEEMEGVLEGRLGPEVLAGETWRLIAWNSEELVPDSIGITLTYDDGNFAGSAGCNRYFNAVTSSDIPGDVTVGIGGSTRMMCPPEIMVHEDRYLAILPKVNQIGFLNGRLYLGYLEDGSARILLFDRSL